MRVWLSVPGRRTSVAVLAIAAGVFVCEPSLSAAGQSPAAGMGVPRRLGELRDPVTAAAGSGAQQAAARPAPATVKRLTLDEAVALALEANLGIKAERLSPQIEDLNVARAQSAFTPEFYNTTTRTNDEAPPDSFLVGDAPRIVGQAFDNAMGIRQQTPWRGGRYQVEWNATRSETTAFTSFNPRLRSTLDFRYVQPLIRGFTIDQPRWQLESTRALRDIADVQLRQSIVTTTRAVRNAYWDLVFTIANLQV